MNRMKLDWSKHELIIQKSDDILIHALKKPDTICGNVKFINTNGILVVTGDYGNWVFCREFHPSTDGYVSDSYWIEKLKTGSCQDPYVFDSDVAQLGINELKDQINHCYSDNDVSNFEYWISELEANKYDEWSFHSALRDYPPFVDAECLPDGKKTSNRLLVVFDAFDEICRRL